MRATTNITEPQEATALGRPHDLNHRAAGEAGFNPLETASPIIPPNLSDTDGFDIGLIWPKSADYAGGRQPNADRLAAPLIAFLHDPLTSAGSAHDHA